MIANYHTHTRWCNHAVGEIEEVILAGISAGLEELAITEHVPQGKMDYIHLPDKDFVAYNAELEKMIEKYSDKIRVIKGFECEYYPDRMKYYKTLRDNFGYKVFALGHHNSSDRSIDNFSVHHPHELERYAQDVCTALRTGFFTFLAHPDVVMNEYHGWDKHCEKAFDKIFATAAQFKIPVEINANGMRASRAYPCRELWQFSKNYDLIYIINSDAHNPNVLVDSGVQKCEQVAAEMQISITQKLIIE